MPPQPEFGLVDVVALIGAPRSREHKSVPEIRRASRERGVAIAGRTVTNLLDRYDELLAVSLADDRRRRTVLAGQGRVILALDGLLQPDVGHEVLRVVRDCLSGEILLAKSPPSATADDLAALLLRQAACGRRPTASACRSRAWSVTGSTRSAGRRRGRCRACRTSPAGSITGVRPPTRSSRPAATPGRN